MTYLPVKSVYIYRGHTTRHTGADMKAKTMNALNAENKLMSEILEAIKKAADAGMSNEDITTVLDRISEVIRDED